MQLAYVFSSFSGKERTNFSKYIKLKFSCKLRARSKALRKDTNYHGNYDKIKSSGNKTFSFFLCKMKLLSSAVLFLGRCSSWRGTVT